MNKKRIHVSNEEFNNIMHGRQKAVIVVAPEDYDFPGVGDILEVGLRKAQLGPPTLLCRVTHIHAPDDYDDLIVASINRGMDW